MNGAMPKNNANNVGQIRGRPRDFETTPSGFNHPDDMPLGRLQPLTLKNYPVGPSASTLNFLPKFEPTLPVVFEKMAEDSEYLKYGRGILQAQDERAARDARLENLPWLNGYSKNVLEAPAPIPKKVVVQQLPKPQRAQVVQTPYESAELMRPQRPRVETKNIPMTSQPESGYYTASPRSPPSLSPF